MVLLDRPSGEALGVGAFYGFLAASSINLHDLTGRFYMTCLPI